jgi:hypothetical protein
MANERVNALGYPLDAAIEMHGEGMAMLRRRLRRETPELGGEEVEALVAAWIADRPYDSPGRVRRS